MAVKIGDLFATISLDDKISKGLGELSGKLKDFGKGLLPLSAGLGAVGIAGFKMSNDLNKAMADVASLMPGNTARILEMKGAMSELGHVTGKSSVDLAQGLYQVVSANVAASDQMKVLEIAARASAAGLSTTRESIDLLSLVTKGYGVQSVEATQKVADLALLTVRLGKTTFPELAGAMGTVVPIAAALKVSQEELFAAFATLVGVTGDANEVSTQLKSTMSDMMKPSQEMAAAVAKLGYSGVQAMISNLGLVESVRKLAGTTDGTAEQIGKLFNNVRALPAVFALTEGQAKTFDEKLKEMQNSAGTVTEAMKEQTDGVNAAGFAWTQLEHSLAGIERAIGQEVGNAFVRLKPVLEDVVGAVKDGIKAFGGLPQPVKDVTLGVGAFIALLGPGAYALGTFVAVTKTLSTALGFSLLGALGPATIAVAGFFASFKLANLIIDAVPGLRTFTNVVGDAMFKLTGLPFLLDIYNKHMEKGKDVTKGWTEEEKKALEGFKAQQAILKDTNDAFAAVAGTWPKVTAAVTNLNDAVKKSVAISDEDIRKKMETVNVNELLQKATELTGEQIADPMLAARIVALAEAQDKNKEATKKHADEFKRLQESFSKADLVKQMADLAQVLANLGLSKVNIAGLREEVAKLVKEGAVIKDSALMALFKGGKVEIPEFDVTGLTTSLGEVSSLITEGVGGGALAMQERFNDIAAAGRDIKLPVTEIKDALHGAGANAEQVNIALSKTNKTTRDWAATFSRISEGLAIFASIGGPLGDIASMIGGMAQATSNYSGRMSELTDKFNKSKDPIEQAALKEDMFRAKVDLAAAAATMLGGALMQSTNAHIAQAGAALQGAAAGAKMGASFGPLGAGIGAVVGGIFGFISAGKKMRAEVTKLYDEFVKTNGGMEKLKERALEAGVSLEDVMKNKGTKNVQAMKVAIEEATAKMEAFSELLSSVGVTSLDELTVKAQQAGVSLQAIWDAKTVEEYQAAIDVVKGKMDLWNEANEKLNDAMERYGIAVEQLGPKFAQQRLNEQALQLLEDFKLLSAAGVDMNVLLEKMGPNMSAYVQAAINAGATIPEAMRPVIDQMITAGQLLDSNGNAYASVEEAGIKFGKTQEEMFDLLITKIDDLVNALLGIPDADYTVTEHRRTEGDGGDGGDDSWKSDREMGIGGIVRTPTRALIGEAGPEAVVPLAQYNAEMSTNVVNELRALRADMTSREETIHIPVHIEGRVIGDILLRRNKAGLFRLVQ